MSNLTNDAMREDYGDDVELPTKENSMVLWYYAPILRTLKEAKRDLSEDSYKDLVETLESELQRRAALSETPRTLGDIVREEMARRESDEEQATRCLDEAETDDPLSRERLEANGWDYVATVDTKNPDWRKGLSARLRARLRAKLENDLPFDINLRIDHHDDYMIIFEAEMKRLGNDDTRINFEKRMMRYYAEPSLFAYAVSFIKKIFS